VSAAVSAAPAGNGFVQIVFSVYSPPDPTSPASLTVPSSAGQIHFQMTAAGDPAPGFMLKPPYPSWLSLDATTGLLSGTIPARLLGTFSFVVVEDNLILPNAEQAFTLRITAPPLTPAQPSSGQGHVTVPFSESLATSGGIAPYRWSVGSGSLPVGLSLSPSGVISGTPTAAGTSTFTAKVSDSAIPTAESASVPVTITIAPRKLTVTTASLPAARVGTVYSRQLSAVMGIAPLHWSIVAGSLPAGLSLNPSSGVLTGVPTFAGTSAFTLGVSDATTPTAMRATRALQLVVHPYVQPAVFVTAGGLSLESFALGASGNSPPLSAISGLATGLDGAEGVAVDFNGRVYVADYDSNQIQEYAYSSSGNLSPVATIGGANSGLVTPVALTLDGALRLYVANIAGNKITVYATGANGATTPVATLSGPTTGLDGPSALTFDGHGHLWVANEGNNSLTEYPATAHGDLAPLATIAGANTGLAGPQGMTLDGSGNLLVANFYSSSLTEYGPTANGNAAPLRTIGGTATGLALPQGVDVDSQGNIYVANENAGVTKYSPQATGNAAPTATIIGAATGLSGGPNGLAVAPPLSIHTERLRAGRVSHPYRARLRANLGTTPYHWTIRAGRLPAGVHLRRDGLVWGRPRRGGVYHFAVGVRDASHPAMTSTRRLTLTVRSRRSH
jgi:sugar lactone lactonase YvrE